MRIYGICLRYVTPEGDQLVLRESSLTFCKVGQETGAALAEAIVGAPRDEKIVVGNMRGQAYDGCSAISAALPIIEFGDRTFGAVDISTINEYCIFGIAAPQESSEESPQKEDETSVRRQQPIRASKFKPSSFRYPK